MDWFDLLAVHGTLKKSSPRPQFKSINSWGLSFLYSSTPTSIHDYWNSHSFDCMDKFGLGVRNKTGQRLIEFCQENTLVIANTLFQQHKEDSTHGHYKIVNTKIRLIIFFAAKDGEALYS